MGKGVAFLLVLFLLSALLAISVKPAVAVSEDSWTSKSSMPTARVSFGVAVVNGRIFAIGGWDGSILNTTEMYNPETDTWTTKAAMPTARSSFGIAVVQNKIYVIGGQDTGLNEVYDPETDTWTTKASMPTSRSGIDANVVNGKIYVIGGSTTGVSANASSIFDVNEVYDPATDTWTTKAPVPTPEAIYPSAVVDNKIYMIGGNFTQIYDTETNRWSYGAPIPVVVQGGGVGVTTGVLAPKRIYVIGGVHYYLNFFETTNFTQVYDPETDVWSMGSPMPTARTGVRVAVVEDVLYAIGGNSVIGSGTIRYPISGSPYGTNEQYTPEGYTPTPSPEPTPTPEPQQTEQFPTTLVAAASAATIAVVGVGLLVYFKKRKR